MTTDPTHTGAWTAERICVLIGEITVSFTMTPSQGLKKSETLKPDTESARRPSYIPHPSCSHRTPPVTADKAPAVTRSTGSTQSQEPLASMERAEAILSSCPLVLCLGTFESGCLWYSAGTRTSPSLPYVPLCLITLRGRLEVRGEHAFLPPCTQSVAASSRICKMALSPRFSPAAKWRKERKKCTLPSRG